MSRIGAKPITIPSGVSLEMAGRCLTVKGVKGELNQEIPATITVDIQADRATISRVNDEKQTRAFHGLVRSLVANMVTGVSTGYTKKLELVGTGYRAKKQGTKLVLSVGFSHPVEVDAPQGVTLDVESDTVVLVAGTDKQKVGQMAANLRAIRPPEPYKGKGIRYQGETIRRKAGKAAKVGA